MKIVFERIENNVEKGENACYIDFFIRDAKSWDCVVKG